MTDQIDWMTATHTIWKSNVDSLKHLVVPYMGPDCFSMRSQTKHPSYIKIKHAPLKEVSHLAIVESPHGSVNGCILSSKTLKVMMDLKQLQSLFRVKKNNFFVKMIDTKKNETFIQKAYSIKKKSLSKEALIFNSFFTYSIHSLYAALVHSIRECITGSMEFFTLDFT